MRELTEQENKIINYAFAECDIEGNDRELFKAGFMAGLKSRICDKCFTDSWKDPKTGNYKICGYCQQQTLIQSLEAKITALEKELEDWNNTMKSFMS